MSIFSSLFRGPAAPLPYAAGSPEEFAARWVRWVAGIGPLHNPVADDSGADAGIAQPTDVWFLAGTFGGSAERHCAVPSGLPLFVPAFNMWHWPAESAPPHLPLAYGELTVDDVPVELDRIATPVPFEVAGAFLNPVTRTRKPIPVTVWGLWRRLDPLPTGQHVLRLAGGDGHGFRVGVTYHLDVTSAGTGEAERGGQRLR